MSRPIFAYAPLPAARLGIPARIRHNLSSTREAQEP